MLSANGGGYIKGLASTGAFKPFGIEQVEMLSERLEIDLHIEYAEVRIDYVLHNPGPRISAEAGFPSAVEKRSWLTDMVDKDRKVGPRERFERHRLEGLEVTVDGRPMDLKIAPDDLDLKGDGAPSYAAESPTSTVKAWHVFTIDFAREQTRKVTVKYRHPYADAVTYVTQDFRSIGPTLAYIFSSAAAWKGPIRQGVVSIRAVSVDPDEVRLSHPKRFQREGSTWTWNFADFEPTLEDDMAISVRPGRYQPESASYDFKNGEVDPGLISYVQLVSSGNDKGRWELHRRDYAVEASSTLSSEKSDDYRARNVADYFNHTVWVEGAPGDGIGESLTLTLPMPSKVRKIGIVNGYATSKDLYVANNRVAKLDVSVDGAEPFRVNIPDELITEFYYFELPHTVKTAKTIKLTIAGVHKGTQFSDTCIANLVLVVPLEKAPKLSPVR